MDTTETLMRNLITDLILQSRIRRQDADPKMNLSNAGDTVKINSVLYFDEGCEQGHEFLRRQVMFRPKEANNFELICTSNVSKDLNHIVS